MSWQILSAYVSYYDHSAKHQVVKTMLGILVAFVASWALIWLISREHIFVLGIKANYRRLKEFSAGFLFMASIGVINFLWQSHFKEITYQPNPNYELVQLMSGVWWTAKAVIFEELIYRGAILYLLIWKIGVIKACLLDALVFGIYHWFSYQMFGAGIVPMIYVLLLTGAGGWMFAFAFANTKSLFAPVGLHLGWNLVAIVVFSSGPLGNQWLLAQGEALELSGWATLMFFSLQALIAPGIVTWYLHFIYPRERSLA